MLFIHHPVLGWWFDDAVGWFGNWVEGMLSQTESKPDGKGGTKQVQKYRIENLLGMEIQPRKVNLEALGFKPKAR